MEKISTDIELVSKLQLGDVEAFDQIYKKYSTRLYAFGMKYFKSEAEAEEMVQSVFLKVWETRTNLKKELSFNSYLFTIAYNDICKIFRKRNYNNQFVSDYLHRNSEISSETEDSVDFRSVLSRVEQIIDILPDKQKLVFRKSRFEGLSSREIADELKLSVGSVDNYISDALKFLKSNLKKDDLHLMLFVFLFFL